MKAFASFSFILLGLCGAWDARPARAASEPDSAGNAFAERQALHRAVRNSPEDASAAQRYAEFLDRYDDPEAREAYGKALSLREKSPGANDERAGIARRLVLLDLLDGDRQAAIQHWNVYRAAGGKDWPAGVPAIRSREEPQTTIEIPGALRSFSRMAAFAPEIHPEDLLPALARNVVTNGYQASSGGESLEPTEYMKLLNRYLSQARELSKLAGEKQAIRIEACDTPQTGDLLRILGYRMRGGCGSDVVLETVNAGRAFLTIDSGFPIAQLEQALRTNRPFVYEYKPSRVPVLYGADYWLTPKEKQSGDFIDVFLGDPSLCRAYLGFSKLDPETAGELRKAIPIARAKAFAHVLDFFGGMFAIRNGKAIVPGGERSAAAWAELAGTSPSHGAAFFDKLLSKDDGWMASYFDALARVNGPVQDYLTQPERLKRFYMAVRGRVTSPGPARPVFRSNTDLMLLTTRLRLEPNGRPHVPGNLDVWKNLFVSHPHSARYDSRLSKAAAAWKDPDDVLEALFGMCRKLVENDPLKIFMAISDLDRWRAKPLEPATVDRLARDWKLFGAQYAVFSESPVVSDATILRFLDTARAVSRTGDSALKADSAGTFQGLISLWQILVRQGSIPEARADETLSTLAGRFATVRSHRDLFDAGREAIGLLLTASNSPTDISPQDRIVELLAGTADTADSETQAQVVQDMIRIFEAQRLISLKSLFDLADNLDAVAKGGKPNIALVNRIAARIAEIQPPRGSLTTVERNTLSFGYWSEKHIDEERRIHIKPAIDKAAGDPEKLKDVRGLLAPLLRDTIVGFSYMHYAPPAAQILTTNPVFVRSHDFIGLPGMQQTWRQTELIGSGWPSSAGGRLMGSLAGLPYALAEAEQNFMVPAREQALIWGDLAPQLMLSSKVPRWWSVTPGQMHWVGLHMRYGERLVAEGALDPKIREQAGAVLARLAAPGRVQRVMELLEQGEVRAAVENITPSELMMIAQDGVERGGDSPLASEIRALRGQDPDRISYAAISRAFGTPKPTLTNSYHPELLYLRTFPTLMGYSSRIMAESWESTILYWASVADSAHVQPTQLNVLIPEWTKRTLERVFATNLEDWPALLRSLRGVGDDVRLKLRMQMDSGDQKASLQ